MQLSPHFSYTELTVTHSGLPNVPSPTQLNNLRLTARGLELVRAILQCPILVDSGFRSPAVNHSVGGTPNSAHLLGFAADIRTAQYSPLEVCRKLAASNIAFDQLIHEFTWTHIAFGPTPGRRSILTAVMIDNRVSYRMGLWMGL